VAEPRTAVRAIGTGLRLLHDRLPVADFPFGSPEWVTDSLPVDRLGCVTATHARPTR
jgi:kanamycin kinase